MHADSFVSSLKKIKKLIRNSTLHIIQQGGQVCELRESKRAHTSSISSNDTTTY